MIRSLPTILSLLLGTAFAGCASCPYDQRCDGDQLEVCLLGVDQMFGDPSYSKSACEAPNPVCVETSKRHAQCVIAEDQRCSAGETPPRCEPDALAVRCERGYAVAEDCAVADNDCFVVGDEAHCGVAPPRSCTWDTYRNNCEDDGHLLFCSGGFVARSACGVDTPSVCEPHVPKDEYEQSAYCRSPMPPTPTPDAGVSGG